MIRAERERRTKGKMLAVFAHRCDGVGEFLRADASAGRFHSGQVSNYRAPVREVYENLWYSELIYVKSGQVR